MKFTVKKFIILILIILFIIVGFNIALKRLYKLNYKPIVEKYSKEFGIEKELIFSIIKNESNFDKDIISNKNAIGLMQILETTKKDVEKIWGLENLDLYNEEDNILVGTKYISILKQKYNNIEFAIAAYNAGPRKCR